MVKYALKDYSQSEILKELQALSPRIADYLDSILYVSSELSDEELSKIAAFLSGGMGKKLILIEEEPQ